MKPLRGLLRNRIGSYYNKTPNGVLILETQVIIKNLLTEFNNSAKS